jgi:putative zinc finger/helix-turn-helix YgiT family protein
MKLYCEYCKKYEDVKLDSSEKTYKVKDLDVTATIKQAFCVVCNHEVYDEKSEIDNDLIFFDAYKFEKGLLTSKDIKDIRSKYGISQTTYSKILGFGEKTIARYETGSVQDKSQDNLMRLSSLEENYLYLTKHNYGSLNPSEKKKIEDYLDLRYGMNYGYKYKPTSISSYQTIIDEEGEDIWKTQLK